MARDSANENLLAGVPLFSACSRTQLQRIARLAERVEAQPNHRLTEEGQPGREFYVIESGRARVTLDGRTLDELGEGDFFGEMALLDQGPRAATVTALTTMRLLSFKSAEFGELLDAAPDVGRKILRGIARRLREANGNRISAHD